MKQEILHNTLEKFTARTGIKTTWKEARKTGKDLEQDGYVRFHAGKQILELPAEIKSRVIAAHLPRLQELQQKLGKLVVLAGEMLPREQQQLKEMGIFFIDGAGNAFIREEGFFVHTEGKKAGPAVVADARAFSKGGIKVIFQLLLHDGLIHATMREIARYADVSLDTVHKTMNALKAMGYLATVNRQQLAWNKKDELLTHWMNEYDRRLKPGLFINRFDFLRDGDYDRWKQIKLDKDRTCWGGEPAGELLTNNLKPAEWTLYTTETEMELVKNYRMIPKKTGVIVVYKRFWPAQEKEPKFAPPLLVYADLVNTGERRNLETAQRIFNEHLKNKFQTA